MVWMLVNVFVVFVFVQQQKKPEAICNEYAYCSQTPNCYFKQLARKTQECENLKAEEKYLKQCCQKAGEELAKHSFEYDGKEKNLVVQAIELNEKYEKLKKALEEIEEYTREQFCENCDDYNTTEYNSHCEYCEYYEYFDIINKSKRR